MTIAMPERVFLMEYNAISGTIIFEVFTPEIAIKKSSGLLLPEAYCDMYVASAEPIPGSIPTKIPAIVPITEFLMNFKGLILISKLCCFGTETCFLRLKIRVLVPNKPDRAGNTIIWPNPVFSKRKPKIPEIKKTDAAIMLFFSSANPISDTAIRTQCITGVRNEFK